MTEEWRPVVGYEGRYEVSDLGRVRGVDRYVERRGGLAAGRPMHVRGRVLRVSTTSSGHKAIGLAKDGVTRTHLVHHLVLKSFVGPMPPGLEGCHNDGEPADNRLSNLRWDTRSSNCYDRVRHGRCPKATRTHCPRGHALAAPNLVACTAAQGHRTCLACSRARAAERKARLAGRSFDMRTVSDAHYAAITQAVA